MARLLPFGRRDRGRAASASWAWRLSIAPSGARPCQRAQQRATFRARRRQAPRRLLARNSPPMSCSDWDSWRGRNGDLFEPCQCALQLAPGSTSVSSASPAEPAALGEMGRPPARSCSSAATAARPTRSEVPPNAFPTGAERDPGAEALQAPAPLPRPFSGRARPRRRRFLARRRFGLRSGCFFAYRWPPRAPPLLALCGRFPRCGLSSPPAPRGPWLPAGNTEGEHRDQHGGERTTDSESVAAPAPYSRGRPALGRSL